MGLLFIIGALLLCVVLAFKHAQKPSSSTLLDRDDRVQDNGNNYLNDQTASMLTSAAIISNLQANDDTSSVLPNCESPSSSDYSNSSSGSYDSSSSSCSSVDSGPSVSSD